jgi:hypothetical protein
MHLVIYINIQAKLAWLLFLFYFSVGSIFLSFHHLHFPHFDTYDLYEKLIIKNNSVFHSQASGLPS